MLYLNTVLYVAAFGAAGIRPCVSSFGADQFDEKSPHYKSYLDHFFNFFYLSVTIGRYGNLSQKWSLVGYSDKSSIRKRLVSMLGSISAPTGMASECGAGSSKSIAAANSAGPIRVTAGMIQIRGDLDWSLHKNGMYNFVFSYGTDATDLLTKSAPFEPAMVTKMQDDAASVILRSGFYLFFVSLALLTLSYKLAICIRG